MYEMRGNRVAPMQEVEISGVCVECGVAYWVSINATESIATVYLSN